MKKLSIIVAVALLLVLAGALPVAAEGPTTWYVSTTGADNDTCGTETSPCQTIQYAVSRAAAGDTVLVAPGAYDGIVAIDKALALLSQQGCDETTIKNSAGTGAGTLAITGNTDGVQIGDVGQGFTIVGIDGPPGIERAAIYFQGNHSNAVVKGNNIVANGDAGLITEYGATISGFVISDNEFSGKTYAGDVPGGDGFGSQFTTPNVPRQLVVMGGGATGSNTTDITFTNNHVTGIAGGNNSEGVPQGNTLVTIDAAESTISNNIFEGVTTRDGASLRARRPETSISENIFRSTNLTSTNYHLYLQNNALDAALIGDNSFDKGVYVASDIGGKVGLSIQGSVDTVPEGTTINVLPGTYEERVLIGKSLTLRGAMQGVPPSQARTDASLESIITEEGLPDSNPNVLVDIADGVSQVAIDGFTLIGEPTSTTADTSVIRCGGSAGSVNNATITNNIIDGRYGVLVKSGTNLQVVANRLTTNKTGIYFQQSASNVNIASNEFLPGDSQDADAAAIYLTSSSDVAIVGNSARGFSSRAIGGSNNTRLEISANTFTGSKHAISLWGDTTFVTVTQNVLNGHSDAAVVIKGQDIEISENYINDSAVGIQIAKHTLDTQRVRITNNDIGSNGAGITVASDVTEIVDASGNWWGSANAEGVANAVEGNADYSPWLGVGTDTSDDPGFQGDFSVLHVSADSPQSGAKGHIQEAIDLVSGSTVNVAAGTYIENLTISKPDLTLKGANAEIPAGRCPGDRGSESVLKDGYIRVMADGFTIDGMAFENGFDIAPSVKAAVYVTPGRAALTVKNSVFTRSGGYAQHRGIINSPSGTDFAVLNNSFSGWATGVYLDSVTKATVEGNVMTGNYVGMSADRGTDITVTENAFVANELEGIGIGTALTNVAVTHNSFEGNATAVYNWASSGRLDATENWWGSEAGPAASDEPNGVGGDVDTSNWLSPEPEWCPFFVPAAPTLWVDAPDNTDEAGQVTASVMLNPGGFEVFGFEFVLTYDEDLLILDKVEAGSALTALQPLADELQSGYSWNVDDDTLGVIKVWVSLAGKINGFTAESELVKLSFAAAPGGACAQPAGLILSNVILTQKVDGARIHPVNTADGTVTVYKLVPVSGVVELQGRSSGKWNGVAVSLDGTDNGLFDYDTTTDSAGAWSTQVACGTYDVYVDMNAYLDAESKAAEIVSAWNRMVKLLGGNANENTPHKIFLDDVVAIANVIGEAAEDMSAGNLYPDINADGTINILDLVLAGINYTETGPKPIPES